jgi:hypothetical protein
VQSPETHRISLVMSRSAVRVRSSALLFSRDLQVKRGLSDVHRFYAGVFLHHMYITVMSLPKYSDKVQRIATLGEGAQTDPVQEHFRGPPEVASVGILQSCWRQGLWVRLCFLPWRELSGRRTTYPARPLTCICREVVRSVHCN